VRTKISQHFFGSPLYTQLKIPNGRYKCALRGSQLVTQQ